MATELMRIHAFEPLWITVDGDGPFPEKPYSIDFTDAQDAPCNMFLLMSENGRGKTTLLYMMASLMRLLGQKAPTEYGVEALDSGEMRVQWDIRLRLTWAGRERQVVLSLLGGRIGEEIVLKPWGEADLKRYDAESHHVFGFRRRALSVLDPIELGDPLVSDLRATLMEWIGEVHVSSRGYAGNDFGLPTLLLFSAYRDIPKVSSGERFIAVPEHWGYQLTHVFDPHSNQWKDSLDNLLVWLKWLDQDKPAHDVDGRFGRARKFINEHVFEGSPDKFLEGIQATTLQAVVRNGESRHRLDQLSSGEKNLVQLFLRIGAHMTRHTIILIDEPEVHLHPRWHHRLMRHFREFVRDNPGITLIAATHSLEMLHAFGFEVPEVGLHKGGDVITAEME